MSYSCRVRVGTQIIEGNLSTFDTREDAIRNSMNFSVTRFEDSSNGLGRWVYFYRGARAQLVQLRYVGA